MSLAKNDINYSIEKIEKLINYTFSNKKYLINAITHSSYANEVSDSAFSSNERLEFLGDSVLGIIISKLLYIKHPKMNEGDLSRLRSLIVCENSLYLCSREINLNEYLLLGYGEEITGGRSRISILADAVEAIIGSVFLDGDMQVAEKFVLSFFDKVIKKAENGDLYRDYKSALQEIIQENKNKSIEYKVEKEEGPEHNKTFHVNVYISGELSGVGIGKTKKSAEQEAAKQAISKEK